MFFKQSQQIFWTQHAQRKLIFYKLSKQRILRIINYPQRVEEGIAHGTIAMMQRAGTKKNPYEIWVMLIILEKSRNKKQAEINNFSNSCINLKIISAWKYPGITKPQSQLTIDILRQEYSDYLKNKQ
jgi:hypothetical protein